jgi:streptogramin lyase
VFVAAVPILSSGNALAAVGDITEYPIPSASAAAGNFPFAIALGPDGNLWVTELVGGLGSTATDKVAKVTPSGNFTEYPFPNLHSTLVGITTGPDGNLWVTEQDPGKVAKLTPSGAITEYTIPTVPAQPKDIVAGPDGKLWLAEFGANKIASLTTSGTFAEYDVPTPNSSPNGMALGPDGNLWFTEANGNRIGRVTTAGVFTEYPALAAGSYPSYIAAGPDGNLWFTETGDGVSTGNQVARMTPLGVLTEYPVPTANSGPTDIVKGLDGNLWVTEAYVNNVARVTPAGVFTEYPVPTANSSPDRIASGPDGNVWFTEQLGKNVARVLVTATASAPSVTLQPSDQTVTAGATATFTSHASGTPTPTVRWQVSTSGGAFTDVAGATSDTLTISNTTVAMSGNKYHAVFTNSAGAATSTAATLTVNPATSPVAALPAVANAAYGGYTTAIYVQNAGTATAHIRIGYFDSSGNPVGQGDTNSGLSVHALWTVRQDNGNSLPIGGAGSAVIYSDQPVAAFVNEFAPRNVGDATSYNAIGLPGGSATTLYAPAIASAAYGGYTTGIGVINLAAGLTNITINYRRADGTIEKTQTLNGVGPGAYRGIYSGNSGSPTDANLPATFAGTATITSSGGPIAAVVNETGPGGQFSSYDAVSAGSTTLAAPAVMNNAYGGFNTGIGIQNTGASAGTVAINYYDASGAVITKTFAIDPLGYLGVYQGTDIPTAGAYTARLTSTVPIAAIVNEVAAPGIGAARQSTSYNTFAAGAASLHLPLVESAGADGWSTGEGIMNTGVATTTVTVTYYDAATGATVGSPQSHALAPNASWGLYQPTGGLPNGMRASAMVTTAAGGQVAVICNESSATSLMSYVGQ